MVSGIQSSNLDLATSYASNAPNNRTIQENDNIHGYTVAVLFPTQDPDTSDATETTPSHPPDRSSPPKPEGTLKLQKPAYLACYSQRIINTLESGSYIKVQHFYFWIRSFMLTSAMWLQPSVNLSLKAPVISITIMDTKVKKKKKSNVILCFISKKSIIII